MDRPSIDVLIQDVDSRGTILKGNYQGHERFLIAEIKKDSIRGGHYHNIATYHFIMIGQVMYFERRLDKDGKELGGSAESKQLLSAGSVAKTPAYAAHLLVAMEDSIVIEPSGLDKTTVAYPPYRESVTKAKMP